jgi:hypothetical protein
VFAVAMECSLVRRLASAGFSIDGIFDRAVCRTRVVACIELDDSSVERKAHHSSFFSRKLRQGINQNS